MLTRKAISMGPPLDEDDNSRGKSGRPYQIPPPPASWPAASTVKSASSMANNRKNRSSSPSGASGSQASSRPQVADLVPSWSGFDEDFEVELAGRGNTTFFVRVAGRKLAATNGVAVAIHGVSLQQKQQAGETRLLSCAVRHVAQRRISLIGAIYTYLRSSDASSRNCPCVLRQTGSTECEVLNLGTSHTPADPRRGCPCSRCQRPALPVYALVSCDTGSSIQSFAGRRDGSVADDQEEILTDSGLRRYSSLVLTTSQHLLPKGGVIVAKVRQGRTISTPGAWRAGASSLPPIPECAANPPRCLKVLFSHTDRYNSVAPHGKRSMYLDIRDRLVQ